MRIALIALASGTATQAITIHMAGFVQPTSIAWVQTTGRLFVAEKGGRILTSGNLSAPAPQATILDISAQSVHALQTYTNGDLGLTAVALGGADPVSNLAWMYANYAVLATGGTSGSCADTGVLAGRAPAVMVGCPVYGRISRWQVNVSTGAVIGAENIVADHLSCTQFNVHGLNDLVVLPSGSLLVSGGAGENVNSVDFGQFGVPATAVAAVDGVCGGRTQGGAFRAQNTSLPVTGKVATLNSTTGAWTTQLIGMQNPWKLAVFGANVYVATTGQDTADYPDTESAIYTVPLVAGGTASPNAGYPCWRGALASLDYLGTNDTYCSGSLPASAISVPTFAYRPVGTGHISISAVAVAGSNVYFGDYSAGVVALVTSGSTYTTLLSGVYPSDMQFIPGVGIVYADVATGKVVSVAGTIPSPSVSPTAAAARIVSASGPVELGILGATAFVCAVLLGSFP